MGLQAGAIIRADSCSNVGTGAWDRARLHCTVQGVQVDWEALASRHSQPHLVPLLKTQLGTQMSSRWQSHLN